MGDDDEVLAEAEPFRGFYQLSSFQYYEIQFDTII